MDIKRTTYAEVTLSMEELKEKMISHLGIKDPNIKVEPVIEYDDYDHYVFYVTGITFKWTE